MRLTSSRRAETTVIRIVAARFYNLLTVLSPMIDSKLQTHGQKDVHARGIVGGVTSARS